MILRFMRNPLEYLEEYFKRERAESLIFIKRRTRWIINKVREERIHLTILARVAIHNLLWSKALG
ncbi:hypothetical protein [Saccharolobus solfataricus]